MLNLNNVPSQKTAREKTRDATKHVQNIVDEFENRVKTEYLRDIALEFIIRRLNNIFNYFYTLLKFRYLFAISTVAHSRSPRFMCTIGKMIISL